MHPEQDVDPPRSRLPGGFVILLAVAAALVLYVSLIYKPQRPVGLRHPSVGGQMPNVTLDPLLNTEEPVSIGDLHGKVTLIDFWGPWCGYCIQEFPELLPLERKYRGRDDVKFLMVSYSGGPDESREELR